MFGDKQATKTQESEGEEWEKEKREWLGEVWKTKVR